MVSRRLFNSRTVYYASLALCLLLLCANVADARKGNKKLAAEVPAIDDTVDLDQQQKQEEEEMLEDVHYIVQLIAKEIYKALSMKKYKFLIYMTIGKLPSEEETILLLSTICNLLYGICILCGFLFLPRGPMLFFTLVTMFVGPALVLVLLGLMAAVLVAFAQYPIYSVSAMCFWFFMTSQLAQTLGKRLGMDSDGDGDVDWLDLLHVTAKTRIGEMLGLNSLHKLLNQASQDPWQQINHRLNEIDRNTRVANRRFSQIEEEEELIKNETEKTNSR